jgi:hypothetical protein
MISRFTFREQRVDIANLANREILLAIEPELSKLVATHSIQQPFASQQVSEVLPAGYILDLNAEGAAFWMY